MKFNPDTFEAQVLSYTSILDTENTYKGVMHYRVEMASIRVNPDALNAWMSVNVIDDRFCFDSDEEYVDYLAQKKHDREICETTIANLAGIPGGRVTQCMSEFFNVTKIGGIDDE